MEPIDVQSRQQYNPSKRFTIMIVLLCFFVSCFRTTTQPLISIPPIALPKVEHAMAISPKNLFKIPKKNEGTIDLEQEERCIQQIADSRPTSDCSPAVLTPLVITVEIDKIRFQEKVIKIGDFQQPPTTSIGPSEITEVFERMEELVKMMYHSPPSTQKALQQNHTVLLAIDKRVSLQWVHNLIFSLGKAELSSFAFLVHDPSPKNISHTTDIGGLKDSTDLRDGDFIGLPTAFDILQPEALVSLQDDMLQWKYRRKTQTHTHTDSVPRYLGLDSPPNVIFQLDKNKHFDSLGQGFDLLSQAEVYCVDLSTNLDSLKKPIEKHPVVLEADVTPYQFGEEDKIPVFLVSLPMIGHPMVYRRIDGARCLSPNFVHVEIEPDHDHDDMHKSRGNLGGP